MLINVLSSKVTSENKYNDSHDEVIFLLYKLNVTRIRTNPKIGW